MVKRNFVWIVGVFVALFCFGFLFMNPVQAEGIDTNTDQDDTSTTEETDPLNTNGQYILYHRETCSHCKKVIKFLEDNNVKDKVVLRELPSDENDTREEMVKNKEEFTKVCAATGLSETECGLPFLTHDGTYKVGDSPIITYLKSEFGIEEKTSPLTVVGISLLGIVVIGVMAYFLLKD